MADNRNGLAATWVTKAIFGFLTLNSGLAIHCARGDPVSILFVSGSYATLLLLLRCLRDYERAVPLMGSPARRAVPPLTTVVTLGLGVVNCDMAVAIHKAGSDPATSAATCALLLASYAALLALIWFLLRELAAAGPARRVVVGSGQEYDQTRGGGVGAADVAVLTEVLGRSFRRDAVAPVEETKK